MQNVGEATSVFLNTETLFNNLVMLMMLLDDSMHGSLLMLE